MEQEFRQEQDSMPESRRGSGRPADGRTISKDALVETGPARSRR